MGAAGLFGEAGCGKTRLARILLHEFADANWLTGYLPGPAGTPRDMLAALEPEAVREPGAVGAADLQSRIAWLAREGRPMLLAVDDVQAARGTDFLETLRTLLNVEKDGGRVLSLLLIGQPGMERRLAAASFFDTRLGARAILNRMTRDETKLYMLSHLKNAGSRQGIFTHQAAERVVSLSRGTPRQVNRLCEMSLVIAFGLESEKIGPDIVDMAAADLDMPPDEDAAFLPWPHPKSAATEAEAGYDAEAEAGDDVLAGLSAEP